MNDTWPGWPAIHKSARDNMIRKYLRARDPWLKAYYRKRALANAEEMRMALPATKPMEAPHERAA